MSRRYRPVGLLCLILAFVSLLGYLWPAEKADPPVRVLLPNAGGPVVFNHAEHVATGIDCLACHHTSKPAPRSAGSEVRASNVSLAENRQAGTKIRIPACGKCHGVKVDDKFSHGHIVELEDYAGACISCHHPMPMADRWGHKKHVSEYGVGCRDCHHKEKENIEQKPESCATCHFSGTSQRNRLDRNVFPGLADAVHARCASCHQDRFGQAFAKSGKENGDKANAGKDAGQKHPPLSECLFCHGPTSVTASQKAAKNTEQASQQHQARAKLDKSATGIGRNPDIMRENCSSCHAESLEKLVPGRMDAFHRLCMGCHEKQGKGPYKAEAFAGPPTADPNLGRPVSGKPGSESCIQCHTGK